MRIRTGVLAAAGVAVVGLVVAYRERNWGATQGEQAAVLPGDELVPDPAGNITRAIGIRAPAERVWPWLVQIGQDRGGMYSYDGLENLFGLGIHSAEEIRPQWQDLAVGDRVVLVPPGWAGMKSGYSLPVARIDQARAVVLLQSPPEHPWHAVWSFVIEPDGPGACRLISRSRAERLPGLGGRLAGAAALVMDPVALVMTRKMLLGIKERAERGLS